MYRSRSLATALLSLLSLSLIACGGGGGGGNAEEDNGIGRFLGAAVTNLSYTTPSQSGRTDEEGRFFYEPGEDVTFRIGATVLGTTRGKAVITPVDLSPGATAPTSNQAVLEILRSKGPTPECRLTNMLVFLQTIDEDDDLENGIQIPEQVYQFLAGTQLPFDRPVQAFAQLYSLRRVIRDGLQAGLWGGAGRPIREPRLAIDHFCAHAGIEERFEHPTGFEFDGDADQTPDQISRAIYSSGGLTLDTEDDSDGNGSIDSIGHTAYNEHGGMRSRWYDYDNDGSTDFLEVHDRNDSNELERETIYRNGLAQSTTSYTLDDYGLARTIEYDEGVDGNIDARRTLFRNSLGLVERSEVDVDLDGNADGVDRMTYSPQGVLRSHTSDKDFDGNPERRRLYDAQGRRTLYEDDADSNGVVDRRITTSYDDATGTVTRRTDEDGNGTIERVTVTVRRADGRTISETVDDNADGQIDYRATYAYLPDRLIVEEDTDGDDSVDDRTTTYINASGNPTRTESDIGADGSPDAVHVRFWEPGSAFTGAIEEA